jgi:hypothetical protein
MRAAGQVRIRMIGKMNDFAKIRIIFDKLRGAWRKFFGTMPA